MLEKFGVRVRTGFPADASLLDELRADHVIVATGCSAFLPPQFESGGHAITALDAMCSPPEPTQQILIFDVERHAQAITVAEHGCKVTVAVPGDGVAAGMPRYSRVMALKRMAVWE